MPLAELSVTQKSLCALMRVRLCFQISLAISTQAQSLCDGVRCPFGAQCDEKTGVCKQIRAVSPTLPTPPTPNEGKCLNVDCPGEYQCDPSTGKCVPPANSKSTSTPMEDQCIDVQCPNGYHCDITSGICRIALVEDVNPILFHISIPLPGATALIQRPQEL